MNVLPMANFQAPEVHWLSLAPILIVLGGAVLGILVEAFAPAKVRRPMVIGLSILATAGACVMLALRWEPVLLTPTSLGEYIEDPLTVAAQSILVIIGFMAVLVMADRTSVGDGAFAGQPSDRPDSAAEELTERKGYQRSEMFPLTLFSLGGMMIFPAADNFVTLFVALEVMSLPLYIMAATARHRRQLSYESALKYFVLGAFSSGFMLMGSAFLFGFANSLRISAVGAAIARGTNMDWMVLIGVFCVMVGLLFKVGAAPFHAWTPDVYTGAPTPVTGFMAAAVKVAAFGAMIRFYTAVAAYMQWDLLYIFAGVAVLTILVGTFAGLVQDNVKRMLAYSAIAHAGFMLIGILAYSKAAISALSFYALTYGIATVGAFGIITLVRSNRDGSVGGEDGDLEAFKGLGRRSPWAAGAMTVFLLSFAGVPLTAGFMAKFRLFATGLSGNGVPFVILAIVCSAVTAFFYMRLIVLMFFHEPDGERSVVVGSRGPILLAVGVAVMATIGLGVLPQTAFDLFDRTAMLLP